MAFDTVSISSNDVPLKSAGSLHVPITSTSLKEHYLQHCDFCEEVFPNKYEALIHNAKHIIIPLIKRELHQCPLCLFYFTSRYKLKHHIRNKHKSDVVKLNENVNIKNDVTKSNEKNVNIDDDKQKIKNEKNFVVDKDKEKKNYEKNHVIDNDEHKKNEKSKDIGKVVTIYESDDDDDDLPLLVNGHGIDETEKGAIMCQASILREALLKDVKVVVEKIKLKPEKIKPKYTVKVPEKIEIKPTHKEPEKNEPKVNTTIIPEKIELKFSKAIIPDQIEPEAKINAISAPKVKISSRLRFEDDIEDFCDDAVMKDLTTDCIVNMNLFDEPWFDEFAKSIDNDEAIVNDGIDDIISIHDDGPEDTREIEDNVVYTPSTHHDDLIKPGVYRCKKCQQMFPTRFNQIQHEMSHMHIRKPRPLLCEHCDRFIANKKALKDHIASKHLTHYRPRTYRNCTKCGLKYNNYEKHLKNYHKFLKCHLCNKGFETEIDRLNHIRGHLVKIKCDQCGFVASELEIQEHKRRFHRAFVSLAEFHLCDVCCLFLKNKHNTHYVFGDTVSKLGSRLDCEHCGNKFFHVTQVRRTVKGRPNDRFQFEKEKERKKVLTNTERLKNIQQRLKMINKLSRF